MAAAELEMMKDIPGYKVLLKAVIKNQIQQLVEQLAVHTDEESIVLTASVADGTLSHLGSKSGKGFLDNNEDIKSQFLGYCLKNYHRLMLQKDQLENPSVSSCQLQTTPSIQTSKSPTHVSPQRQSSLLITPTRSSPRVRHEPYPVGRNSGRTSLNIEHGKRPVQTITLTSPIEHGSFEEIPESLNQSVPEKETPENKSSNQSETTFQSEETKVLKDENAESCENSSKSIPSFPAGQNLDSGIEIQADEAESENDTQPELDSYVTVKVEAISESDMELEIANVESLAGQASQRAEHSTDETLTHKTGESASGSEVEGANKQLGKKELQTEAAKSTSVKLMEKISTLKDEVVDTESVLSEEFSVFSEEGDESLVLSKDSGSDDNSCGICGKKLSTKQSLRNHLKLHAGGNQFKCYVCDKSYLAKDRLDRHMAVHTGLQHLCPNCGACFQTEYSLKRHIDIMHLNKGPYVCEKCGKAFSSKGHFLGHQSASHGEKNPYECEKCQKSFSYKKNLQYHVSKVCCKDGRVAALHQCEICEKSFKAKRYLKQHKQIHAEGNIVCHVCGRNFRWRSSYKEHKKTCHT